MDKYVSTPFNIDILILDKNIHRILGEVKKTNIFEPASSNFEPEGLYSTSIFGKVGTSYRNQSFGYINLNTKVMHPLVYQHVSTLKSFYKDIMFGKKHAIWDKKSKDFILSDINDGETGYTFFLRHLNEIKFERNESDLRNNKISLVEMFRTTDDMLDKWLVLPAGLRDYTVSEDGKTTEDEVNDIYKKLLTTTLLLNNIKTTPKTEHTIDSIRIKIQVTINEIYDHFRTLLDGKNKFVEGKFAKRATINGTRNVMTPPTPKISDLDGEDIYGPHDTMVGLYQFIRAISPITMNKLQSKFISKRINTESTTAKLVNPKTLKVELVNIKPKYRDQWVTLDGLDDTIGKLAQEEIREQPVMIDGYYMCMIHDRNNVITILDENNQDNPEFESKYIRPITYYEMIYISIHEVRNKYPGLITRYPVINYGSIYPCRVYVKTTENSRTVDVILNGVTTHMEEFPNVGERYIAGVSPAVQMLEALGGDYDGDVVSLVILYSDTAIRELNKHMDSKGSIIGPDGKISFSFATDTLDYVISHLGE